MDNEKWIDIRYQLPVNGEVVDTMVCDSKGTRNEQPLRRRDNLWFFEDDSMHTYYTPTHWRKRLVSGRGKA